MLDLTSLTVGGFQPLVPPFEAAFQAHMAAWRLDGPPRTARRYTTSKNCPLPTPEDRLLCILVYLKTYPLQVVQGRPCGMGQGQAHPWIHVLLIVLQATLRTPGDTPARSLTELAQRLGVAVAEATALALPPEQPPTPAPVSPLVATMAPKDASRAAACALSTSTAASTAAASSTTPAASGRPACAIASWKSAVPCITFASG